VRYTSARSNSIISGALLDVCSYVIVPTFLQNSIPIAAGPIRDAFSNHAVVLRLQILRECAPVHCRETTDVLDDGYLAIGAHHEIDEGVRPRQVLAVLRHRQHGIAAGEWQVGQLGQLDRGAKTPLARAVKA